MPSALRGSRLSIARSLRDGSKTATEIGNDLGKETGTFFGVVKRMTSDGLVHPDTGTPKRGTRYSLTPQGRQALARAERESSPPGTLSGKQQLLLIEQPSRMTTVQQVLAKEWISGCVAWAAEVGGGWLLAIDGDASYPIQRLMMALEQADVKARALIVNDLISGDELHDRAVWLLDDVAQIV